MSIKIAKKGKAGFTAFPHKTSRQDQCQYPNKGFPEWWDLYEQGDEGGKASTFTALHVEMPQERSRPQQGRWNMVTVLFLDMVVGQLIFLVQDAGKLSS